MTNKIYVLTYSEHSCTGSIISYREEYPTRFSATINGWCKKMQGVPNINITEEIHCLD